MHIPKPSSRSTPTGIILISLAMVHAVGCQARRSWENPNSHHFFIALDMLDAASLSRKVGVSRPYDPGGGFRERQPA